VVYLDTGCLVKLYYPEPDSDLVAARSSGQAIVYTPLHTLELTTALELKVFRKEATIGQAHAALGLVEEDLSAGKLVAVNTALLDSLDAAVQLARQHASRTGCRALDTLHCATAMNLDVTGFLSTDARQLALARIVGLRVIAV
jgi:predicted nucleic acid-binding protein